MLLLSWKLQYSFSFRHHQKTFRSKSECYLTRFLFRCCLSNDDNTQIIVKYSACFQPEYLLPSTRNPNYATPWSNSVLSTFSASFTSVLTLIFIFPSTSQFFYSGFSLEIRRILSSPLEVQRVLFRLSPSQCLSEEYKFWNSSLLFFAMFLSSVHVSPSNENRSRGNFASDYGVKAFSHIVCLGAKSLSVSCPFIPAERTCGKSCLSSSHDRWMSNASPLSQQLLTIPCTHYVTHNSSQAMELCIYCLSVFEMQITFTCDTLGHLTLWHTSKFIFRKFFV